MSTFRPRRTAANAANTPVISKIQGYKTIKQSRAEAILTKFISTTEAIATSDARDAISFSPVGMSNGSTNKPILGQLKRIQRDLRGLPPLSAELELESEPSEPKNKKIKFDDAEDESSEPSNSGTIAEVAPEVSSESDKEDSDAEAFNLEEKGSEGIATEVSEEDKEGFRNTKGEDKKDKKDKSKKEKKNNKDKRDNKDEKSEKKAKKDKEKKKHKA